MLIKEDLFRRTDSDLASIAETIVEYVVEVKKPDGERLPGFHEAELESLRFKLFSPAPIYPLKLFARSYKPYRVVLGDATVSFIGYPATLP